MTSDPRQPVDCKMCQAQIIWARNEKSKKKMPFDAQPHTNHGTGWELYTQAGEAWCRYVKEAMHAKLRRPHFETCPNYNKPRGGS